MKEFCALIFVLIQKGSCNARHRLVFLLPNEVQKRFYGSLHVSKSMDIEDIPSPIFFELPYIFHIGGFVVKDRMHKHLPVLHPNQVQAMLNLLVWQKYTPYDTVPDQYLLYAV